MSASDNENSKAPAGDDAAFMEQFQKAITSYAQAVEAGKTGDAEQAAMAALMLAGAEAMKNPTPELLLSEEASNCEHANDWAGAEAAYLKLLHLREQSGNFGLITKPLLDLSRLCRYLGELESASTYALAATAAARKTEISTLIAMALENELRTALAQKDVGRAVEAAAEAVQIIEPGKVADLMRARALVNHAECLLAGADMDAAEQQLQKAWDILKTQSETTFMVGPIVAFSRWWGVRAELCLEKGAQAEAAEALSRSIEFCRQGLVRAPGGSSPYTRWWLADLLDRFAAVSGQLGDANAAQEAHAEARSIRSLIKFPSKKTSDGATNNHTQKG